VWQRGNAASTFWNHINCVFLWKVKKSHKSDGLTSTHIHMRSDDIITESFLYLDVTLEFVKNLGLNLVKILRTHTTLDTRSMGNNEVLNTCTNDVNLVINISV
jgi:hypothetical protein